MTSQYRHRRSSNPATAFTTLEPGEIAVNTANRQIAVGDAASATVGTPEPLIGVRFFDARAIYAANDMVVNAGSIYYALRATGPAAFVAADWTPIGGAAGSAYVAKTGDTMGGNLTIATAASAQLILNGGSVSGGGSNIQFNKGGASKFFVGHDSLINGSGTSDDLKFTSLSAGDVLRLGYADGNVSAVGTITAGITATGTYYFGNTGTKSLVYDGTNFNFAGGGVLAPNFATAGSITANNGATFASDVTINRTTVGQPTAGYLFFGTSGTKYLSYDGTNFNFAGGAVIAPNITSNGAVFTGASAASTGTYYFGSGGTKYLTYDGTNFNLAGGGLLIGGGLTASVSIASNSGYICAAGVGGTKGNVFNLFYAAGLVQMWIDTTNLGNITIASDYRIKKDVIDLPGMWDTVKALRPIKYTQAQFSPPSHVKFVAEEALKARKEAEENPDAKPREVSTAPLFPADDIERWGFIAHELQATLTESAATGVKDADDTIQSPNPFTILAALTKCLQEAMGRIEALEGGTPAAQRR